MSPRWYPLHLSALLSVLLVVQAPRLGGPAADLAAPVFARDRGFTDLDRAYYPAAQLIRRDPSVLYRQESDESGGSARRTSFVYIPLVAWLFVPLSLLPLRQAGAVLLVANIAIALGCLLLLQRRVPDCRPGLRWAITLGFATSGPLHDTLNLGQTSLLVLLLLLLSERSLHRGCEGRAGLWLGLASVIKVPPLIFLPYLAIRRGWRALAAATAVLLLVVTTSIGVYGRSIHVAYFDYAIRRNWGTVRPSPYNQSLDASGARLVTEPSAWSSRRPLPVAPGAWTLRWLGVVGLVAACVGVFRARRTPIDYTGTLLELGALMCLGLLVFPISWVHYGIWLLPVAVIVGGVLRSQALTPAARWWGAGLLAASVLLINLPVPPPWVIERLGHTLWFRLAISHQFVGTLILLGLCLWGTRAVRVPPARVAGRVPSRE